MYAITAWVIPSALCCAAVMNYYPGYLASLALVRQEELEVHDAFKDPEEWYDALEYQVDVWKWLEGLDDTLEEQGEYYDTL
jgi:hypothetical protein